MEEVTQNEIVIAIVRGFSILVGTAVATFLSTVIILRNGRK